MLENSRPTRCVGGGRPIKCKKRYGSIVDKNRLLRCVERINILHDDRPKKERWLKIAQMYFETKKVSRTKLLLLKNVYKTSIKRSQCQESSESGSYIEQKGNNVTGTTSNTDEPSPEPVTCEVHDSPVKSHQENDPKSANEDRPQSADSLSLDSEEWPTWSLQLTPDKETANGMMSCSDKMHGDQKGEETLFSMRTRKRKEAYSSETPTEGDIVSRTSSGDITKSCFLPPQVNNVVQGISSS